MGEVYRARDTRLGRTSPSSPAASVADDPDRRARSSARRAPSRSALASRTSARSTTSADATAGDTSSWSCVDGETLAKRLARGPLPLDEALPLGRQIAEALDAAHRAGIVHRDLKPANVMLTDDGRQAPRLRPGQAASSRSGRRARARPTRPPHRRARRIVGTPHYMAPEQLEGRARRHARRHLRLRRVLYEMLTGRKAFDGVSAASVTAAILKEEPASISMSGAVDPGAPPALDHVIRRALAKHRKMLGRRPAT